VAHSVYELGVVRGRAEWGNEEWREQLLCVLETPDLSRNRRRGEEQPADAGEDPDLTDGSVAAWRGSMITPGDWLWLSCCGGGVEVGCCLVAPCVCLTGVAGEDRRRAINEGEDYRGGAAGVSPAPESSSARGFFLPRKTRYTYFLP